MSIQVQFTNSRASEAPAARQRQERGARQDDKAFALPEPARINRETAPAPKERPVARASSTADETRPDAEASKPDAADKAQKTDKGQAAAKPEEAGAPKQQEQAPATETSEQKDAEQTEQAQPLTGVDFLIAMAAAQVGATTDATADAEMPPEEGEKGEGKGKQAAATAQPTAAPVVPLPITTGAELVNGDAAAEGQAAQAVSGDTAGHAAAKAAPALSGKVEIDGKAEAGAKSDSATKTALATAAADHKPFEMLLQPAIKAEPGKLIQQLDPNNQMANAAGAAPGQTANASAGVPTPVHLVPVEIGLRAMSGAKQFDIRLDPAELGRVDVNLSISDTGEVSAKLVVDRVETLHLLQRDARTLERAFEQAGLKPSDGGVDISLRDPSDQSAFRQNRQHDEAPQRSRAQPGAERTEDASLSIDPVPQRRLVRLGGVDLSI
ncbi:flagellar hook-length control protein FliK [Bosea thiooxidans]